MISATWAKARVWKEADLAVFESLQTPLWIFDFTTMNKWWANSKGL
jgi:hypothetical protein